MTNSNNQWSRKLDRQINVEIRDVTGESWRFKGLRSLMRFLRKEARYWKNQYESINVNDNQIHEYISCYSNIEQSISNFKSWSQNDWDDNTLGNEINGNLQNMQGVWLYSDRPSSNVFVECNRKHGEIAADTFINFIRGNDIGYIDSNEKFLGIMVAYEFLHQDSDILKRRKAEKASIGHLRNSFEATTSELINEVEGFKKDFNSWGDETRQKWADLLGETKQEHSDQMLKRVNEFVSFKVDSENKIQEMENTYQEKLRMEKPAKYWNKAAKKFRLEGFFFAAFLIISLVLGAEYLSNFFTEWLQGKQLQVQLDSLQGIVIFGTFIAVFAFLIRVLSRLTFSAFHLMRDAEEREQLTYLYLSLINEKKIDEESRDLILQALFSRSETGLLTGESGPTMPGVGMSEIINLKK